MLEHSINSLNNFISGYYIDTDICNNLIKYFQQLDQDQKDYGHISLNGEVIINKDLKDSIDHEMPPSGVESRVDNYINALYDVVGLYIQKYPACTANGNRSAQNSQILPVDFV